jgi:WD40 repeat protein
MGAFNVVSNCHIVCDLCSGSGGHCDDVISVQFYPTTALMATSSNNETAKLWVLLPNQMSATCVATLKGHMDRIYSNAFHPSAPLLATSSVDKTAKLRRISPDQTSASFLETLEGHSDGVN